MVSKRLLQRLSKPARPEGTEAHHLSGAPEKQRRAVHLKANAVAQPPQPLLERSTQLLIAVVQVCRYRGRLRNLKALPQHSADTGGQAMHS